MTLDAFIKKQRKTGFSGDFVLFYNGRVFKYKVDAAGRVLDNCGFGFCLADFSVREKLGLVASKIQDEYPKKKQ